MKHSDQYAYLIRIIKNVISIKLANKGYSDAIIGVFCFTN